jgi:hypothetical protein
MIFRPDPDAFYSEFQLRLLGLDGEALEKARDRGELRGKDVGADVLYKGAWLIEWLERDDVKHNRRRQQDEQ